MAMFSEEFMIATENRFKKFIMISITGMKKDYYRKEIIRSKRELSFYSTEMSCENLIQHDDKAFENNILETSEEELLFALKSLTEKQLQIVKLLELENFTESEAAKLLNISQQDVHKSKVSAIRKLKNSFRKKV